MAKKVLIVGGVAGGASTAARLRRLDEDAQIILFERGEYISYANCGLPYHIGNVIADRNALLLMTPTMMKSRFNIDVRTLNEVLSIDRAQKTITVRDLAKGITYEEAYDVLVLAPGSSPLLPPIPGRENDRILSLWTVPDTDRIRATIKEKNVRSVAVIGGGFIGLEMAENLREIGLSVAVVEMQNQVMAPLDYEMAQLLHEELVRNEVQLFLGDGVKSFERNGESVSIALTSGRCIAADLVILSIGVRPNGGLAKEAGLTVNARGGIVVDAQMRTSDPAIYAVGDAIEVEDFVFGDPTMVPLAGPANKQGRIAADNIAGGHETYKGTQGASIAKVFSLSAGTVGANEKTLIRRGLVKGQDYESLIITQYSHARYYPGATPMAVKLLFSLADHRILGAQAAGQEGVDKLIDTISVAMRLKATAPMLKDLEMAYAPPYSSAKSPVNMAGYVAENILNGTTTLASWDAMETDPDLYQVLDIREAGERAYYRLQNATEIPFGQIRAQLDKLSKDKHILVVCAAGVRAHSAACLLKNAGFQKVSVYPGGTAFYRSTHYEKSLSPAQPDNFRCAQAPENR